MKIKTADLQGKQLRWAVAKSLGLNLDLGGWPARYQDGETYLKYVDKYLQPTHIPHYEEWWEAGGPILEREGILLRPIRSPGHSLDGQCLAKYGGTNTGTIVQWVKREGLPRGYQAGPTMLIAGMRCFVASKMGDEVEIPEELL